MANKVEALERRVEELENHLAGNPAVGPASKDACPYCGIHTWWLKEDKPHPQLGPVGGRILVHHCKSCGKEKETVGSGK